MMLFKVRLLLLLITIFGNFLATKGQDYVHAEVIFEMLSEHADMSEFFECRDTAFQIVQFKLIENTETLEFVGRCSFAFIDNEVIKTTVHTKKRSVCKEEFWKWIKKERGEKFGYIERCSKNGKLKKPSSHSSNLIRSTVKIIGLDSIVDQKSVWVSRKGDSICWFLDRYIYRNDTLIEYWHDDLSNKDCSWGNSNSFSIVKYYYPAQNTKIIETYNGTSEKREIRGKRTVIDFYTQDGKLAISKTVWFDNSNMQRISEDRYFHENGKWKQTERWYDGKLIEIIKKVPIS